MIPRKGDQCVITEVTKGTRPYPFVMAGDCLEAASDAIDCGDGYVSFQYVTRDGPKWTGNVKVRVVPAERSKLVTHYPPHIKPLPNVTVLLVHYYPDDDSDPAVSTGSVGEDGEWTWDKITYRDEELSVDLWLPLPLIPERP